MTFAEYNTDENFDNDKSSLEELVKIGKSEGMSKDSIRSALSPKWQKSSKINKFDEYYGEDLPKKKEPSADDAVGLKALGAINGGVAAPVSNPPEKKKEEAPENKDEVVESVIEQAAPTKEDKVTLDKATEKYMSGNNDMADYQEDKENERQRDKLFERWDIRNKNIDKMSDSMRKIDDKLIDQLPTFMFKRYLNDEFGDHKSTDAKLRLAHFLINGVGTALQNASAAIKGGPTQESDIQKYNRTNLEQGLENRWNKYKQETQAAIDLAKQGGMSEEEITNSIAKISSNNRLQSVFNQMNERQKVYALQVLSQVGDKIGNMNDAEFANTLMGMSAMGDSLDPKEAAGMLVYRLIKDPKKRDEILNKMGLLTGGMGGGLGGGLGGLIGGNGETEPNPDATLEDGTNVDSGKVMTNEDYDKIAKAAEDLGNKYYNGEIDEEKFRSEYGKLEAEMKKHGIYNKFKNIKSADSYLNQIRTNKRVELSSKIDELNTMAKNGQIKPSEYEEQFKALKADSEKWGASKKELQAIEKGKIKNDTILKAAEKNAKKKK